ncbi:transcription/translation regulatory transformer protein RfaH [Porticoccaceae bacterium]|jgi:transcriptional antiterminator RfaH|nr:transcription/translation regulatory transformer protein RfaH [Porticoccaceae bacterium]MDA8663919.1 transcription/translation regulatory transformer protein RfaH [Porticoccaceae bacterium]MDA8682793.1 transcription/translation regulatory transformer protein RfaH [Porticoccaceae bacterium]MDB2486526.1 transcription/translation regulatory transformer protein RfaH [Porticoccaceae bacterium]MDB2635343.1 transcription/translation regulatory transformer protein RfaH [Porticoccaceae bacterium]
MSDNLRWFLLQTKPKQEQRAVENLVRQEVQTFCPMVRVEKVSRGKRVETLEVLFSGYLFVQLGEDSVSATSVRSTRGVSHFVTSGGAPIGVPELLIEQLRERVAVTTDLVISRMPKKGEAVQIMDGPFRGLNAVFSEADGTSRAIVLVTMLNQKVEARVPLSNLSSLN